MDNEVTETAKAVQEVAKTTKAGIEATEKFGGFVARIIGEPIDEAVGMLTDKLKYARWERRERLKARANQFIEERNIKERRPVPPKIALPIIENGSLEHSNELQDIWARFLASAVDPNYDGTLRTAFIDIIKQLEVVDVHILNFIYNHYTERNNEFNRHRRSVSGEKVEIHYIEENRVPVSKRLIIKQLEISENNYKESIDNLIRVRCVASHISNQSVEVPSEDRRPSLYPVVSGFKRNRSEKVNFNVTHIYDKVCITSLGISFAKACMPPISEEQKS